MAIDVIRDWNVKRTLDFFQKVGFEDFSDIIERYQIDGDAFLNSSEAHLNIWRIPKQRRQEFFNLLNDVKMHPDAYLVDPPPKPPVGHPIKQKPAPKPTIPRPSPNAAMTGGNPPSFTNELHQALRRKSHEKAQITQEDGGAIKPSSMEVSPTIGQQSSNMNMMAQLEQKLKRRSAEMNVAPGMNVENPSPQPPSGESTVRNTFKRQLEATLGGKESAVLDDVPRIKESVKMMPAMNEQVVQSSSPRSSTAPVIVMHVEKQPVGMTNGESSAMNMLKMSQVKDVPRIEIDTSESENMNMPVMNEPVQQSSHHLEVRPGDDEAPASTPEMEELLREAFEEALREFEKFNLDNWDDDNLELPPPPSPLLTE